MAASQTWTDADFEQMSWHDNHVYAMRIEEGEWGAGKLYFDLDYITEWLKVEGKFSFRIVPALLTFSEVTDLRISLDYAGASAATSPFHIHTIQRRTENRQRYIASLWKIEINWPKGEISFEASGFQQIATGEPILCDGQYISRELRTAARI